MRGCGPALLFFVILIVGHVPLDAQYWAVGLLRDAWLGPTGRAFLVGLLGASVGALVWYSAIWNALAYRIYLDDVSRAEDAYRRRRR